MKRHSRYLRCKPGMVILEEIDLNTDWQEVERQWIAHGRSVGWRLTNCTDGGDGVVNLPPEIKERMAKVWIGRKHKPESLLKIGIASKGRKASPERKEKMRLMYIGRTFTPEWLAKIAKATSKLSDNQIMEIRWLMAKGVSQYAIADMYGVHQGTISNIKRRLCYQGVGFEVSA